MEAAKKPRDGVGLDSSDDIEPCTGKLRFHSLSLLTSKKKKQVASTATQQSPDEKPRSDHRIMSAASLPSQNVPAHVEQSFMSTEIFRPSVMATGGGRRNRQYGPNRLPTLDESDSSEVDSSFDEDQIDPNAQSPPRAPYSPARESRLSPKEMAATGSIRPKEKDKLQLFTSSTKVTPNSSPGASSGNNATHSSSSSRQNNKAPAPTTVRDRIATLIARADESAAHGNDEIAFNLYRAGLKLTRAETAKIKAQLKKVDGKHPTTIQSIHSRLHEDWLDVGQGIAEIRQKMAIMCERCGDYARALSCGKEAKEVLERHLAFLSKRSKKYPVRLEQTTERIKELDALLEKMKASQASFDDRKAMHEQIIMMRKQIDAEQDPKRRQDLLTTTTMKVQKALQTETRVLGLRHPQIADTLSLLATLAYERGMIESSREFMKEAIDIALDVLGDKHPNTGEMFLQAARIFSLQDEQQAMEYYTRAIAIFRGAKLESLVGSALNEVAVLQIRRKKYLEAMAVLNEALDACTSLGDAEYTEITTQIHRNLGECYSSLKDHDKAVSALSKAVDLQREVRKESEVTTVDSFQYIGDFLNEEGFADTLRRLGKSYMYCGKHGEALTAYGEALAIHRSHVIKAAHPGLPSRALPERQDQLAHTLFCMAEVHEAIGDLDEALKLYSESMQLRLFSDAHRAEKRLNMVHCAMCLRGLGNVHMAKKEYEAALKVFEDALTYCEAHGLPEAHAIRTMIKKQLSEASKLAEDHVDEQKSEKDDYSPRRSPSKREPLSSPFPVDEQQRILSNISDLERLARRYIDRDDQVRTIETLTRLMAARKALLKLLKSYNKDATEEKYDTARTLLTFGKVLLKNGDPVNAERALDDAMKLFKKNRTPRDLEGIKEVQQALKTLNGVQL